MTSINLSEFAIKMQHSRRDNNVDNNQDSINNYKVDLNQTELLTTEFAEKILLNYCDREIKSNFLLNRPESLNNNDKLNENTSTTCVLGNGNRFFLKSRQNNLNIENISNKNDNEDENTVSLLSKPIKVMEAEVERIKIVLLARKNKANSYKDSTLLHSSNSESELWVNKYTPKVFSHLLSSEKINRGVLRALKSWDLFVFKDKKINKVNLNNVGNNSYCDNDKALVDNNDNSIVEDTDYVDQRPLLKVILLSGPPGTGKTTLAHCVSNHCGYCPYEVNASDDRSADVLKDLLTRAMHGNTIHGTNKPNCIILDEIDGIDGRASIDALVSIINNPLRSITKLNDKKSGKKKSNKGIPLTRPLICICNDQYSPALRELRKLAQIFVFKPPEEIRLMQRLKNVCNLENVQISSTTLTSLCNATGNDIRSSLNTLQFAALRTKSIELDNNSSSSSSTAGGMNVALSSMINSGIKDEHKDEFQVLREVFSTKLVSQNISHKFQKSGLNDYKGVVNHYDSCMEVMQSASAFGDINVVLMGIFENLFQVRFRDASLTRITQAINWLSLSDRLDTFTRTVPDGFQVLEYLFYFNSLFN
jgi:chromosome transmission fidelity protein 18